jgi:hypothetical protein
VEQYAEVNLSIRAMLKQKISLMGMAAWTSPSTLQKGINGVRMVPELQQAFGSLCHSSIAL